jgi:dynein heavy chain, axonemal
MHSLRSPKRVNHLPLSFNASNILDRQQPILKGGSTIDISDPSARPHGKKGVFSELLTNPEEFIDNVLLVPGQAPPIPPLEGLLGAALSGTAPKSKTFKRPDWKRDYESNIPRNAIKPAFQTQIIEQSEIAKSAISPKPVSITENFNPQSIAENISPAEEKRRKIDYQRALEPKVVLPYESKPGQTPRKIEIERRKRLYSQQKIGELINVELMKMRGQSVDADKQLTFPPPKALDSMAEILPLSSFDNTEFDQRTTQEWLDMTPLQQCTSGFIQIKNFKRPEKGFDSMTKKAVKAIDNQRITIATVPVPGKAFLVESHEAVTDDGQMKAPEWKDCLVTAYDSKLNKWKVRVISYSGWELDGRMDDGDDDDEYDEMEASDSEDEQIFEEKTKGQSHQDRIMYCRKHEAWLERYNIF